MKKFFLATIILICNSNFLSAQNGWQVLQTNTTLEFLDIQCYSTDTLFLFGEDGILLKSFDAGNNFTTLQNASASIYTAGFFKTPDTVFVGNGGGNIVRSGNGGSNWGVTGGCTCFITSICFSNNQFGLYSSLGGVFTSSNGGNSWSANALNPFFNPNKFITLNDSVFVAVYHKSFYKSTNSGQSFNADTLPYNSNFYLYGLSFISDSVAFSSTGDGKLFKTTDQGATWNLVADLGFSITDIVFIDSQNGFLISGNQQKEIRKTSSGGLFWSLDYTAASTIKELNYDGHHVFACGQNGMALRKEIFPTTINEQKGVTAIKIYPNPAGDQLTVYNPQFSESKIYIIDILGRQLFSEDLNQQSEVINLKSFCHGIYFLRITDAEKSSSFVFEKL